MRAVFSVVAAILPAALIEGYALAQPAPNTAQGVKTSSLCASVTVEYPQAPWCHNPQNGTLYVWDAVSNRYVVFQGISNFGTPTPFPTPSPFPTPTPFATPTPFPTPTPFATPTPQPGACQYAHVPAGNATYGNNSPFQLNFTIANEQFPTGITGKIVHISCQNLTGGTCNGNPPQFEAYIVRGGVEVFDSSPVVCSSTRQLLTDGPTNVDIGQAFQSGDIVGMKVSTAGSSCNGVYFDPDLLVGIGSGC